MKVPIELVGCWVYRTGFDYQVRIYLSNLGHDQGRSVDAELVIEAPFVIRDAVGHQHPVRPGTAATLVPVLDLFQNTIAAVGVGEHGSLHLTFTDGTELLVFPDPEFESWHLHGHGVGDISVGPGGEIDWDR